MAELNFLDKEELKEQLHILESSLLVKLRKELQIKKPEEYLTRTEVAVLLKINVNTVDRWSKTGKLKRYGIGDRIFYKRTEVEKSIIRLK